MQRLQETIKIQGMEYRTYRRKKILMNYTVSGQGAPLLIIHDLKPGSGQWEWQELVRVLARHFTVYAPDLPGYGHSSENEAEYGNFLYTMLIKDFVEDVVKASVYLVGVGRGAAYGAMACHFSPDYYKKLLLVTPHGADGKANMPQMRDMFIKWMFESPVMGAAAYNIMAIKDGFWAHRKGKGARMAASKWYSSFLNLNFDHKLRTIKAPFQIMGEGAQSKVAEQCISFFTEISTHSE